MVQRYNPLHPLAGPGPQVRRRNPLWRFRRIFFVLGVLAVVSIGGVWAFASQVELEAAEETVALSQTTYICTAEVAVNCGPNNAANEVSLQNEERVLVKYEDVPEVFLQALLATEDQHFFDHSGVDPRGVARAAYQIARQKLSGQAVNLQGGSTLTQQYIKLITRDDADALSRKAREMVRAIKYEQLLTEDLGSKQAAKEAILERYLNTAYFGRSTYGIAAASQAYFGKDLSQVTIPEAAFLAGVIRNPSAAEPSKYPEVAAYRRDTSLVAMARDGHITQAEKEAANADGWSSLIPPPVVEDGLGEVKGSDIGTEYFIRAVRDQLEELFPQGYFSDGLRVYTTLRPDLQRLAYSTVYAQLDPFKHPDMPQGSLVTLDDNNAVVAMVGDYDWNTSQVNLAMGTAGGGIGLQAGSQMKVFALAEYIEQGYSLNSFFDAPRELLVPASPDGLCARKEFTGGGFTAPLPGKPRHRDLYNSTAWSRNTVFVQVAQAVGPRNMNDMAVKLGLDPHETMIDCPTTVLGSNLVAPLEMANAYSTLLHEGIRKDPVFIQRIEDAQGNVLCYFPESECSVRTPEERQGEEVLNPSIARQVVGAMEGVINSGTGKRARLLYDNGAYRAAAGKTGTSTGNRDAWFTGFTCGMTTSVWVGTPGAPARFMNDSFNRRQARINAQEQTKETGVEVNWEDLVVMAPLDEIFAGTEWTETRSNQIGGGDIPAQIWHDFMLSATADLPPCESLPTEPADTRLRIQGQELATTIPWCATTTSTASTLLDENLESTTVPETTTTTVPLPSTSVTVGDDGQAGTEGDPPPNENADASPPLDEQDSQDAAGIGSVEQPADSQPIDDEEASGLVIGGSGGGVFGSGAGYRPAGNAFPFPIPTEQETTTTTEPCLPVDDQGQLLPTTIPVPGQPGPAQPPAGDQNSDG